MGKTVVEMRVIFCLLAKFFSYILQPLFFILLVFRVLTWVRYEPTRFNDLEMLVAFVVVIIVIGLFVSVIYDLALSSLTKELLATLCSVGILEKEVTTKVLVEDIPEWVKTERKLDKPVECFSGINSYNCLGCFGLTSVNVKREFERSFDLQRVELQVTEYKLVTKEYNTIPLGLLCKFGVSAKLKFIK